MEVKKGYKGIIGAIVLVIAIILILMDGAKQIDQLKPEETVYDTITYKNHSDSLRLWDNSEFVEN